MTLVVSSFVDDSIDLIVCRIAERHHGVFAAHHLREQGISEHDRKYRLKVGRWVMVHERVYRIAGTPPTWHGRLLAACWAGGAARPRPHRAAAELWGLPGRSGDLVELTCPRWRRARHPGVIVHESLAFDAIDIVMRDAIPVTTAARTLFDLAGVCGPGTLDLAIDNALETTSHHGDRTGGNARPSGAERAKGKSAVRRGRRAAHGRHRERSRASSPADVEATGTPGARRPARDTRRRGQVRRARRLRLPRPQDRDRIRQLRTPHGDGRATNATAPGGTPSSQSAGTPSPRRQPTSAATVAAWPTTSVARVRCVLASNWANNRATSTQERVGQAGMA